MPSSQQSRGCSSQTGGVGARPSSKLKRKKTATTTCRSTSSNGVDPSGPRRIRTKVNIKIRSRSSSSSSTAKGTTGGDASVAGLRGGVGDSSSSSSSVAAVSVSGSAGGVTGREGVLGRSEYRAGRKRSRPGGFDHDHPDMSAGVATTSAGRVPIPSFTPVDDDGGGRCDKGGGIFDRTMAVSEADRDSKGDCVFVDRDGNDGVGEDARDKQKLGGVGDAVVPKDQIPAMSDDDDDDDSVFSIPSPAFGKKKTAEAPKSPPSSPYLLDDVAKSGDGATGKSTKLSMTTSSSSSSSSEAQNVAVGNPTGAKSDESGAEAKPSHVEGRKGTAASEPVCRKQRNNRGEGNKPDSALEGGSTRVDDGQLTASKPVGWEQIRNRGEEKKSDSSDFNEKMSHVDDVKLAASKSKQSERHVNPTEGKRVFPTLPSAATSETIVIDIADDDDVVVPTRCDPAEKKAKVADGKVATKRTGRGTSKQTSSRRTRSKRKMTTATAAKKKRVAAGGGNASSLDSSMSSSPAEEDEFDVPRAKAVADAERRLDQDHADFLRGVVSSSSSTSAASAAAVGSRSSPKKRGRSCTLCTTCSCRGNTTTNGALLLGKDGDPSAVRALARSQAEVERALIARLTRLEKSAAWFEHLRHKVGRELRKHRATMVKRDEAGRAERYTDGEREKPPRFLPDADDGVEGERPWGISGLAPSAIGAAQGALFAFHKNYQPTLTQMCGKDPGSATVNESNSDSVICIDEEDRPEATTVPPGEVKECEDMKAGQESALVAEEVTMDSEVPVDANGGDPCKHLRSPATDPSVEAQNGNVCSSPSSHNGTTNNNVGGTTNIDSCPPGCGDGSPGVPCHPSPLPHATLWAAATIDGIDTVSKKCREQKFGDRTRVEAGRIGQSSDDDVVDAEAVEREGIDDLLNMFDAPRPPPPGDDDGNAPHLSQGGGLLQSQLSQGGEEVAKSMEDAIEGDPARLQAIEEACPNWRENLRYAQRRCDERGVNDALVNVRTSLEKLARTREEMERIWQGQKLVLELYEKSLEEKLSRLHGTANGGEGSHKISSFASSGVDRSEEDSANIEVIDVDNNDENSEVGKVLCSSPSSKAEGKLIPSSTVSSPAQHVGSACSTVELNPKCGDRTELQRGLGPARTDCDRGSDSSEEPVNSNSDAQYPLVGERNSIILNTNSHGAEVRCLSSAMPGFDDMDLGKLEKLMASYGFKSAPKQEMISTLTRINRELQMLHSPELSTKSTCMDETSSLQNQCKSGIVSRSASESDGETCSSRLLHVELNERCTNALKADRDLRLRMLQHLPVEISCVQRAMKESGVNIQRETGIIP